MHSPYDEGYRSFWRRLECPFRKQSVPYHQWWQGYHCAMREAHIKLQENDHANV